MRPPAYQRLLIIFLAGLFGTTVAVADDQATSPQPSKEAVPSAAAGSVRKAADTPKSPARGGVLVFIDPSTGKIVQPNESDIHRLFGTQDEPRPAVSSQELYIQGPGSAVGVRLDPSSFSYAMATRTPDGKIALDCVTGERAANSRVSEGAHGDSAMKPKPSPTSDEK